MSIGRCRLPAKRSALFSRTPFFLCVWVSTVPPLQFFCILLCTSDTMSGPATRHAAGGAWRVAPRRRASPPHPPPSREGLRKIPWRAAEGQKVAIYARINAQNPCCKKVRLKASRTSKRRASGRPGTWDILEKKQADHTHAQRRQTPRSIDENEPKKETANKEKRLLIVFRQRRIEKV